MRNSLNINKLLNLILIVTPIIFIPFTDDYFYYPKILFVYSVILLMIGIQFISKNKRRIEIDIFINILLAYWILLIISTFFSINPVNSIWGSFRREEGLIAIFAYILLFVFSKTYYKYKKKYMEYIIISAILVSLYGICQYMGFDPIPRDELRLGWGYRAFSTIGNPNFLGTYLILMLPLSIFEFIKTKKTIYIFSSIIIYYCILLTFTRSAWIGFGIILFLYTYYIIYNKHHIKSFILLISLFIIITVFANTQSDGKIYGRFNSIGKDAKILLEQAENFEEAGANRIYIWIKTIELIKEKPLLGYGLENLHIIFTEKYQEDMLDKFDQIYIIDRAHNEYLHIAVSSGVISLIIYLFFILLCLQKGIELTKKNQLYTPYFISIIAYLGQAFFNISVVSVAYIFWIFLGIMTNENVFVLYNSTQLKENKKVMR